MKKFSFDQNLIVKINKNEHIDCKIFVILHILGLHIIYILRA